MKEIKFDPPKTYEEAIERKEKILETLNKYSEDLLLEKEPELTDEEAFNLREEFEILDDRYLTKEEKKQYDVIQANPKKIIGWIILFIYFAFQAFVNFPLVFSHVGILFIELTEKIFSQIYGLTVYVVLIGLFGVLNCFITYVIYRKIKSKEDKKILTFLLIGHVAYFVISFVIFLLTLYKVI